MHARSWPFTHQQKQSQQTLTQSRLIYVHIHVYNYSNLLMKIQKQIGYMSPAVALIGVFWALEQQLGLALIGRPDFIARSI